MVSYVNSVRRCDFPAVFWPQGTHYAIRALANELQADEKGLDKCLKMGGRR